MSKYKRNKTKSPRNLYRYSSEEVANMAHCSISYVKKIRNGIVDLHTHKAQLVINIDAILEEGSNKLLEEVERILSK